eukprot:Sdes_comp20416_c0_seq5m14466
MEKSQRCNSKKTPEKNSLLLYFENSNKKNKPASPQSLQEIVKMKIATMKEETGKKGAKNYAKSSISPISSVCLEKQTSSKKLSPSKEKKAGKNPSKNSHIVKISQDSQKSMKDFFQVRRSERKCLSELKKSQLDSIQKSILTANYQPNLAIVHVENKGKGVIAKRIFQKGDFVCEYGGELIDKLEAQHREEKYGLQPEIGCYMYYFTFQNKTFCVDATLTNDIGRFINHSIKQKNLSTKIIVVDQKPRLCFFADQLITPGDELGYDYGDRSRSSVEAHPWLSS